MTAPRPRRALALLALALAAHAHPLHALYAPRDTGAKETLKELMAETQNLSVQLRKAEKTHGEIAKAELSLSGKTDALARARKELNRLRVGLDNSARDLFAQADRTGCPWGHTSTDKDYVASCNAEGARLNGLLQQVAAKAMTADQMDAKLSESQNAITEATAALALKRKANDADLQDLAEAREDWQRRYNTFVFDSEAYRRLQKMAPGSHTCTLITPTHPDSFERASECLRRLWEGSR